jgi:anti-sigma factor RsiW
LTCHRYNKGLILYLYGEVTDDERRRIERHLGTCAQCKHDLEALRAVMERAAQPAVPEPSPKVLNEIRTAAADAITSTGDQVPVRLRDYRWYGMRPRLVAAASFALVIAAVVFLAGVIGREPGQITSDPPVVVAKPPVPARAHENQPIPPLLARDQSNTLMAEMYSPTPLEDILAELEANAFYLHEQMALETAPVLDRRMRSLEHDVVRLAVELE